MSTNVDNNLDTLTESGTPPETRISTGQQARAIYEMLAFADTERARKRTLVKGLVDGNPPYRQADLKAAGQDYRCNVNWRESESYFNNAVGAFYDLFSEAPTYATIRLKGDSRELSETQSRVATTHFDWLCRYEPLFDYYTQVSQDEMVLYGRGPMVFQDKLDWRPMAILDGELRVFERTKSDTALWELATIEISYTAEQLYSFILDPKYAKSAGWNVERARQAIIHASPEYSKGGIYRFWEWHQQQLKNGSLYYSAMSKTVLTGHLFFREFRKKGESEGKVSHVIINSDSTDDKPDVFMFQNIGRFDNWNQCIHPMYYDRGGGGFHHSVTGMGVKMYSALEYKNRLLCNLADKAFTPKQIFRPTTSTGAEDFSLQQFGDYSVLKEGFEAVQTPISGVMEEGIGFNREISNLVTGNLSQYRAKASNEQGNPRTATEINKDSQQEASLQKTQMNRYYNQADGLYAEMYRRATSADVSDVTPGGKRAKEFVERCKKDGVPVESLRKVEWVKASRVIGQGSEFLRKQNLQELWMTVGPGLPEGGRTNMVDDMIATSAGQSSVERYNPKKEISKLPDDQTAWAWSQVADMKIGVPAMPTDSQNPATFCNVFLQAADQSAGTLQQGADPKEVAAFLDLVGPAIAIHLQRMSQDKSRQALVKQFTEHWEKLAQLHDQLVQKIQSDAEAQQEQQAQLQERAQAQNGELELEKQKQAFELGLKAQKTHAGMLEKSAKTRQSMAITDVKSAQALRIQAAQHEHQKQLDELQLAHDMEIEKKK